MSNNSELNNIKYKNIKGGGFFDFLKGKPKPASVPAKPNITSVPSKLPTNNMQTQSNIEEIKIHLIKMINKLEDGVKNYNSRMDPFVFLNINEKQFRKKYSNEEIIELYQTLIKNGYEKKYPDRIKIVNEYIQQLEYIPDIIESDWEMLHSNEEILKDKPDIITHKYLKYKQKYLKLKQKNLYF